MATPVVMAVGGRAGGKRSEGAEAHHPLLLLLHAHASSSSESKEGKGSGERRRRREMGGARPIHLVGAQRGSNERTATRAARVEDDDNNADDTKSGFVDPRASLTGVLAYSCPTHWPPHRLQVIGGVADR